MSEEELKHQLTAAEEQLAEMREGLQWAWGTIHYAGDEPIHIDVKNEALRKIQEVLSAAPKRGRVLASFDGKTKTHWSRAEEWHVTKVLPPAHKRLGYYPTVELWNLTDNSGLPVEIDSDVPVTVTVREAE